MLMLLLQTIVRLLSFSELKELISYEPSKELITLNSVFRSVNNKGLANQGRSWTVNLGAESAQLM
jgi:hypothetical protein